MNKLLKQTKLSPTEWQQAKKLKGFDRKNYRWSSSEGLYVKID